MSNIFNSINFEIIREGACGSSVEKRGQQYGGDSDLPFKGGFDLCIFINFHDISSEYGGKEGSNDSNSRDEKGVEQGRSFLHSVERRLHGGNSQGGRGSFSEGSKEIGSHACDISHVISDVIGNSSWVLRGVFSEIVLNFSH